MLAMPRRGRGGGERGAPHGRRRARLPSCPLAGRAMSAGRDPAALGVSIHRRGPGPLVGFGSIAGRKIIWRPDRGTPAQTMVPRWRRFTPYLAQETPRRLQETRSPPGHGQNVIISGDFLACVSPLSGSGGVITRCPSRQVECVIEDCWDNPASLHQRNLARGVQHSRAPAFDCLTRDCPA